MEDQTFKNYLHDLGTLIKEHAKEAKEQKASSEGSSSQAHNSGYLMAWYEVVSLMQQQAEAFGIPFESLDLHDIDPDKDLLHINRRGGPVGAKLPSYEAQMRTTFHAQ